jgi:transposase
MSSRKSKKLKRLRVGGLPLIHAIMERMRLREILYAYIPRHGNEAIPAVESLILLIANLTLGKAPLYELEEWVGSLDGRCLGDETLPRGGFNDDRFGRALDKLYWADRASLMTRLVVAVVEEFRLCLDRLHNDSTSVKAVGQIPGTTRTGLELRRGNSKDHRPDLKQLVFSLSLCADGGVPVHQKCYPGNRTDDTTHIETWNALHAIRGAPGFLYVADCKLCTDKQLNYIVSNGGRAITIIPETWKETAAFKESLRKTRKAKKEIWRRPKPGSEAEDREIEYFSAFAGGHRTEKRGYRVHWIYSSEKRKRDRAARAARLRKAEQDFTELNARINTRQLKTQAAIEEAANAILKERDVQGFFRIEVGTTREEHRIQIGRGRPGKNTKYRRHVKTIYTLTWTRNTEALKREARTDGVFPLLCTDDKLSAKEVLQAYKYQPRLEKRFSQFKAIHHAAPLLFKKVERVEANMFAFFIALMIQALIEREVRQKMKRNEIPSLALYPEDREAMHPTTSKIMGIFADVSTYKLMQQGKGIEEFRDDLTDTQKTILRLLDIPETQFWQAARGRA